MNREVNCDYEIDRDQEIMGDGTPKNFDYQMSLETFFAKEDFLGLA